MAKKDMRNNIVIGSFASGEAIDLLGFHSHTFAAVLPAAGAISFKVEESDDNVAFVDVTEKMVVGEVAVENAKFAQIGYKGDCRYVKVTVTGEGAVLVHVAAVPLLAPTM